MFIVFICSYAECFRFDMNTGKILAKRHLLEVELVLIVVFGNTGRRATGDH